MGKLVATEAAQRVVDRAVQLHGGRGVMHGNPVARLYEDVRALRIYEGASLRRRSDEIVRRPRRNRSRDHQRRVGSDRGPPVEGRASPTGPGSAVRLPPYEPADLRPWRCLGGVVSVEGC
ncbi:MAG: acyl-CoA dehydrogenase family protein [Sandaracinaceae bacterium]|nr:acyl-CoA dehydrogenase family protein [Sandaracinaceae bacterium]